MKFGFIYEWTNLENGLKYIGRHEGLPDDGYIGSGPMFLQEYEKSPRIFARKILWKGYFESPDILEQIEEQFLSEISNEELYYGKNRKYYNVCRNSIGFTSTENPMKNEEIVNKMKKTQKEKGLNNVWINTVEKYGYEKACELSRERQKGNKNGSGNKGKPKSAEHKRKISLNKKGGKPKGWKKQKIIV